jgi:group I intron endonuclease
MIIYKTTNLLNGKIYIGKDTKNNINYLGSGKILNLAIKKYGRKNFKKEILEECNLETIDSKEIFWIQYFNSRDPEVGYNIAEGGNGGDTISKNPRRDEIRKNHSKVMKGRSNPYATHPLSTETKLKISKSMSETNNPMYGKSHTFLAKQKIRDSQLNRDPLTRLHTEETKKKISNCNKGKILSQETKDKISKANSGEKNGFYGKTHSIENKEKFKLNASRPLSEDTKQKLRENNLGKYNGSQNKPFIANGIEYSSIGDCNKKTGEQIHKIRGKLKNKEYIYVKPIFQLNL